MTDTAPAAVSAAPGRRRGGRVGLIIVMVVAIAIGAAFYALYDSKQPKGALDPESAAPDGARAVATVLGAHGVHVLPRTDIRDTIGEARGGDVTLVLPFPDLLSTDSLKLLKDLPQDVRVVVVEAGPSVLADLDAGAELTAQSQYPSVRDPDCPLPEATSAGDAELGTYTYHVPPTGTSCYGGGLAVTSNGASELVLLGSRAPLVNDTLDERGNAALSLGLLSAHSRVLWLLPTGPESGTRRDVSFEELLPGWAGWAELLALIAGLLAALWSFRRFGAPVAEPLPVIVRSAESVEGRARLYRRARATAPAYEALRAGAFARILPPLGLGKDPDYRALVEAVAARTGRHTGEVYAVLYGAPPTDDAMLTDAADRLDSLVQAVLARTRAERARHRPDGEGHQQ